MNYLCADTETTGFAKSQSDPTVPGQPYIVELAGVLVDEDGNVVDKMHRLIKPDGWTIPQQATSVHGITTEKAAREGVPIWMALWEFERLLLKSGMLVWHNAVFDMILMRTEHYRLNHPPLFLKYPVVCTKESLTPVLQIPKKGTRGYKWPNLQEAHVHYFGSEFDGAHGALADTEALARVFTAARKEQEGINQLRARDRVASWLSQSPGNLVMIKQAGDKYNEFLAEETKANDWLCHYKK